MSANNATKVIILQGASGSGKSTYVGSLAPEDLGIGGHLMVVSADHYFDAIARTDRKTYREVFAPHLLPVAHGACMRKYVDMLQQRFRRSGLTPLSIVVDNTNTSIGEIAPYVAVGQAYEAQVEIHRVNVGRFDAATLAARNTHGVPEAAIAGMLARIDAFEPMPWWTVVDVTT